MPLGGKTGIDAFWFTMNEKNNNSHDYFLGDYKPLWNKNLVSLFRQQSDPGDKSNRISLFPVQAENTKSRISRFKRF